MVLRTCTFLGRIILDVLTNQRTVNSDKIELDSNEWDGCINDDTSQCNLSFFTIVYFLRLKYVKKKEIRIWEQLFNLDMISGTMLQIMIG